MINSLKFDEFFNFVEELREYDGFKTTIKEDIFRYCRENPTRDHGKIVVTGACYNKIANKGRNFIAFDYVVNKHNLTYSLKSNNTILLFKRAN